MRMKLVFGTGLALVMVTTVAVAETKPGWYVGGDLGAHKTSKTALEFDDVTLVSSSSSASEGSSGGSAQALDVIDAGLLDEHNDVKTKGSVAGFGRVGYQFEPSWRVEAELGYRPADIDSLASVTYNGATITDDGKGSLDQTSLMVNLIYDILPDSRLHPYIGAGLGGVNLKADYKGTLTSPDGDAVQTYDVKSSQTVWAYQFLAGATYQVNDRLDLDLTYRWLGYSKNDYTANVARTYSTTAATVSEVETRKMSGNFSDSSVTVGLRWAFGKDGYRPAPAPTPAPQPVPVAVQPQPPVLPAAESAPSESATPAPAQPRNYTVYFALNSSKVNNDGQAVINEAADFARTLPAVKVAITGYTDTTGSVAYNASLSKKRAKSVAKVLTGKGVPSASISTDWKGETVLAVPTADGVNEPLNRRTTIDVQP